MKSLECWTAATMLVTLLLRGAPAFAQTSPPVVAADAPESPDEVRVVGRRHEIGQTSLSATDVREMPGAFGDPFRAIDALPGVTPMLSGLPYVFVRGAPPTNNGYFVDGIRVPLLFHLGLGPGVIHPALLDRVDFYPGAAPASYGGFAGATIAGQTREPASEIRGAANLRLVDAGAFLEAPFAERGSALVAGRFGYPGPVVGAFSDTTLSYWDYQSRVAWRIGDRDALSVFAFGSHDYLGHRDEQDNGRLVEDFVSDFHRVDLRYDRVLVDGRMRVGTTVGYDSQGASPSYLDNLSTAARLEIEKRLSPVLRVRGGADVRHDAYSFEERGAPPRSNEPAVPSSVNPAPTNIVWGAHADAVWRVAPRVEIVPGARVAVFESSRANVSGRLPAVDPRLATRVTITPSLTLVSAFGLTHQLPTLRVGSLPSIVVAGSGFPLGAPSHLQKVAQASQGIEVALPAEISLTATAFLSGWSGLTDLTASCIQILPATELPRPVEERGTDPPPIPYTCPSEASVHGRAYGVELLVRRPLSKRLSGWLSYTLSRSTREAHFITVGGGDAVATVPSDFDRTHVLNAILAYDLGRRWRIGGRFVFYTGTPYSSLSGNVPLPPYNSLRDPSFYRLDVRLEKRWLIGRTGSIAFVFEGQNVTLSKEASSLGTDCTGEYSPEGGGTNRCQRAVIGPITIPSIGVEASF
jgi:hypothetical protein